MKEKKKIKQDLIYEDKYEEESKGKYENNEKQKRERKRGKQ